MITAELNTNHAGLQPSTFTTDEENADPDAADGLSAEQIRGNAVGSAGSAQSIPEFLSTENATEI